MKIKSFKEGIILAVVPSVLMLLLFYSLVVDMRLTLGGWPATIGEQGFPSLLLFHVKVMEAFMMCYAAVAVFAVPPTFIVCLFVQRWYQLIPTLVAFGVCFIATMLLMSFAAPSGFVTWFMD